MKKTLIALGAAAMLMTACGPGDKYSLKINVPEDFKGETVAILNVANGDTLGSAVANDTIVTIAGTIKTPTMGVIIAKGMPLNQAVIEPGKISFNEEGMAIGTKSNDAFATYMGETMEVITELRGVENEEQQDSIIDNVLVPGAVKFIEKNPNNLYNQVAYQQVAPFLNFEQLTTIFANDTTIAADPNAQKVLKAAENKVKTQPGSQYVDVDILKSDGTAVKLSDFITPGRFTVVDFWASWCNPCKQEIPGLIEIYKQYKDAGVDVLGIAVWDNEADTEAEAKKLGINYPVVSMPKESSYALTEAYGIMGIPCILLIDPQGKIIARDLRGDDINKAVENAIASKRR